MCDRRAPAVSDCAQGVRTVAVETGHDHCNQLAMPVLGQRLEEDGDDIGPSSWLGNGHQAKFAVQHMQIPLGWNDEHVVRLDIEAFGNQLDRHIGIVRQNFVQTGRYRPQVVHDDNRRPEIGRQIREQAFIGVEPARRPAHANNWHVLHNHLANAFLFIWLDLRSIRLATGALPSQPWSLRMAKSPWDRSRIMSGMTCKR